MKKSLLPVLPVLLVSFYAHAAFPPEFNAEYTLKKFGLDAAQANISLQKQNDGSWIYLSTTKTLGLVSVFRKDTILEKSILKKRDGMIKPVSYDYKLDRGKKPQIRTIRFDWDNKTAESSYKETISSLPIPFDTNESFSLQLRLMDDLHAGKRTLIYNIVDKGTLKKYTFEILGNEKVETPSGTFNTLKFKRTRKNSTRTTVMWTAPELHFLPVQIQHIEKNGTTFSMLLSNVSGPITNGKSYRPRSNED